MDVLALTLFGVITSSMVLFHLRSKVSFYEFPFWIGVISLGWFFPQALGGLTHTHLFPEGAYFNGLIFTSLCLGALWVGYILARGNVDRRPNWLNATFDLNKLYVGAAVLCVMGFYFQWKLWTLPIEMRELSQWSGATVKYLFLSSVFRFGFITLWLIYLNEGKWYAPKLLVFIIPSMLILFKAAVLDGRREGMMDVLAYVVIGLWFGKRVIIPRWMIAVGLVFGILLINAIGTYRAIMLYNSDKSFSEKMVDVFNADYTSTSKEMLEDSGAEFKNFIYYRQVYQDKGEYDLGLIHWNRLVFNYVPAQLIGRDAKDALMLPLFNVNEVAKREYGFNYKRGSTSTGYKDAFGSFGWFGFIKFLVIGFIMGILYRRSLMGGLFAQMLYIYMLGSAMLSVTHSTHRILFSGWVYFFALAFPVFYWAMNKGAENQSQQGDVQDYPYSEIRM